jgi:hypothetical protein
MELTPSLIRDIAEDAANRRMRAEGRDTWNEEDWNEACRVHDDLMRKITQQPAPPAPGEA